MRSISDPIGAAFLEKQGSAMLEVVNAYPPEAFAAIARAHGREAPERARQEEIVSAAASAWASGAIGYGRRGTLAQEIESAIVLAAKTWPKTDDPRWRQVNALVAALRAFVIVGTDETDRALRQELFLLIPGPPETTAP